MTKEEKAKAYDEALERAKCEIDTKGIGDTVELCKSLFPELRESEDERIINQLITLVNSTGEVLLIPTNKEELIAWLNKCKDFLHISESCKEDVDSFTNKDERIRKYLIEELKAVKSVGELKFIIPQPTREECISYLEKQKEQKHPDGCFTCDEYKKGYEAGRLNGFTAGYNKAMKEQKPEHFELKAGKWYICHRAFCCRADHLTVKEGERFMCEKDGIVKGFVIKEPEKYFKECSAPAPMEDEQKEPHYTKRNALFDKCVENCDPEVMKEVSDKVDEMLGKEQKPDDDPLDDPKFLKGFDTGREVQRIFDEQKPAEWSEEEREMLNMIEEAVDDYWSYDTGQRLTNFLESFHSQYKLSQEDEKIIENICASINEESIREGLSCYGKPYTLDDLPKIRNSIITWLKSLPERFNLQPKQEWSEEDEKHIDICIKALKEWEMQDSEDFSTTISFLKSLRPSWKPSDGQLKALEIIVRYGDKESMHIKSLTSLYEQLKKL